MNTERTLADPRAGPAGGSASQDPSHPSRGELVGRYVVLSRLGAGGMGVVYAAYDPELDRKIALKLLNADAREPGSDGQRRLLREAQAMAKLSHPNVITVHDVGEHRGRVYLAMEFVEGETLAQWLERRSGSWREILAAFLHAGTGIAAAHAKGLVHRDFKPENVMVDVNGRVRVMDFGLARVAAASGHGSVDGDTEVRPKLDALGSDLTGDGTIAGTPSYMAPEQHLGLEVGPAADQFAFCVALYRALYRQHPYEGDNVAALAFAVVQGKVREPPGRTKVPERLRRALMLGLRSDPKERWTSMDRLLAVLAADHTRRNRVIAGVALLALAVVGLAAARGIDRARQSFACTEASKEIRAVWGDEARASIRAAMLATGASYASTTADKLMPWLDRYRDDWQTASERTCVAAKIEHTLDEELYGRAVDCLDERRAGLSALIDRLIEADQATVRLSVNAAAQLPDVPGCADMERLAKRARTPEHAREAAKEIRRRVARVDALVATGDYHEAKREVEDVAGDAEAVDHPPLIASVALATGTVEERLGNFDAAREGYERALLAAGEAGEDELAAEATVEIMALVGHRLSQPAEARIWGDLTEMFLARAAVSEAALARAKLHHGLGMINYVAGALEEAEDHFERAIAICEKLLGAHHPHVAASLNGVGGVHYSRRDFSAALAAFERALEIGELTLGSDHPDVAASLNNLGALNYASGDYDQAVRQLERALEVWERTVGQEHIDVARACATLGRVHVARGSPEIALAYLRRAVAIREREWGPRNSAALEDLGEMASAQAALGNDEDAVVTFERALAAAADIGPDHPAVAKVRFGLAQALGRLRREPDRAARLARDARDAFRRAAGDSSPDALAVDAWLAEHSR